MARLGDVCSFFSGTGFPNVYQGQKTGKYPFYKVGDISKNVLSGNRELIYSDNYIDDSTVRAIKGTVLPPKTVVFAKIGEALRLNRRALTNCYCLVDNNAMGILPDNTVLDSLYFYYFMCSVDLQHYCESTTVPSVRKTRIAEIEIPLPPLDEQRRIAAVLDKVSDLIAKRREQLDKLDELVKARFVEMFGDIDEVVPLSYYIDGLVAGKSLAGEVECLNKVLKTGAATYDYFDPTQVKNLPLDYEPQEEHLLKTGDVIISRMNTSELVGATAYVWEAPEHTYLPDRLWRAELKSTACPIFVWQILIQSTTKESVRRIASGTSGSMKNISKAGLLDIKIKKVSINAQLQFSAFVEQIHKSKLTIQQSLDKLEVLKKALMQQYFG